VLNDVHIKIKIQTNPPLKRIKLHWFTNNMGVTLYWQIFRITLKPWLRKGHWAPYYVAKTSFSVGASCQLLPGPDNSDVNSSPLDPYSHQRMHLHIYNDHAKHPPPLNTLERDAGRNSGAYQYHTKYTTLFYGNPSKRILDRSFIPSI
jgi:hypothetical protein